MNKFVHLNFNYLRKRNYGSNFKTHVMSHNKMKRKILSIIIIIIIVSFYYNNINIDNYVFFN